MSNVKHSIDNVHIISKKHDVLKLGWTKAGPTGLIVYLGAKNMWEPQAPKISQGTLVSLKNES